MVCVVNRNTLHDCVMHHDAVTKGRIRCSNSHHLLYYTPQLKCDLLWMRKITVWKILFIFFFTTLWKHLFVAISQQKVQPKLHFLHQSFKHNMNEFCADNKADRSHNWTFAFITSILKLLMLRWLWLTAERLKPPFPPCGLDSQLDSWSSIVRIKTHNLSKIKWSLETPAWLRNSISLVMTTDLNDSLSLQMNPGIAVASARVILLCCNVLFWDFPLFKVCWACDSLHHSILSSLFCTVKL